MRDIQSDSALIPCVNAFECLAFVSNDDWESRIPSVHLEYDKRLKLCEGISDVSSSNPIAIEENCESGLAMSEVVVPFVVYFIESDDSTCALLRGLKYSSEREDAVVISSLELGKIVNKPSCGLFLSKNSVDWSSLDGFCSSITMDWHVLLHKWISILKEPGSVWNVMPSFYLYCWWDNHFSLAFIWHGLNVYFYWDLVHNYEYDTIVADDVDYSTQPLSLATSMNPSSTSVLPLVPYDYRECGEQILILSI